MEVVGVHNAELVNDPRIDPRIRDVFSRLDLGRWAGDVSSREELLATVNDPQWRERYERLVALYEVIDDEDVAPSAGLRITDHEATSQPDGNTIKLRVVRPEDGQLRPAVVYLHGGGMWYQSAYDGPYRAWSKLVAANGVVVVLVEFRNALVPSAVEQVAPYPGGLNDCESGFRWVHEHADELGVDPEHVVVAGESGGGNLAIATTMRLRAAEDLDLVHGLYAMCPYIAGRWPHPDHPSSVENEGIFLTLHHNRGRMAYGIEAYEARDPMAWPSFASEQDVSGFPPTVIRVNECDPLRDEGIAFYRLLVRSGVSARCVETKGTIHASEIMPLVTPDISRDAARHLASFAHAPLG